MPEKKHTVEPAERLATAVDYYSPYYGETYQKEGVARTLSAKIVAMTLRAGGALHPNDDPAVDNDYSLFDDTGDYLGRVSADILLMTRTHIPLVASASGEWRHGNEDRQDVLRRADQIVELLRTSTSNIGDLPFRGELEAAACITSLLALLTQADRRP